MNSNGKLIAAVTVIIAVMVVSVSLAAAQAPREQNDDNGASLSNGAPISDHDLVIYLLGAKDLDKDTVISSALTKLALLLVPQIRILNLSLGDVTPANIEITLMNGSTATFHMVATLDHNGCKACVDSVKINGNKTVDLDLVFDLNMPDSDHMTIKVIDGDKLLVTFNLGKKVGVKDGVSSVRTEILSFELPDIGVIETDQIAYFQLSGDELDHMTFIFPDNENRSAVVLHYTIDITDDLVVYLDLGDIEHESNVAYVWCGTYILKTEVIPMD